MPIEFRCAECASCYEVEDDLSGKTIRCRECHGFNRVPFLPPPKETPHPATTSIPKPSSFSSLTFTKGLLIGALLMGLTSGLGLWLGLATRKGEPSSQASFSSPPATRPQPAPVPSPVVHLIPTRNEAPRAQREAAEEERQRQAELQNQWEQQQAKERAAQEQQRRQAEREAQLRALEKAAEAAEKKRQEKLATEFALLSPLEQETVRRAIQTLTAKKPGIVSLGVLERYWIFFDNDACLRGISIMADKSCRFTEFCENLGIPADQRNQILRPYLFVRTSSGKLGGYMTALAVSREYKKVGSVAALPYGYKKFVSANRDLFAAILK